MVTRKPLPESAAASQAKAAQRRDGENDQQNRWSSATGSEQDAIWGDEPTQHLHGEGARAGGPATGDNVPESLRPGAPGANYTGLGEEDNVWAGGVTEPPTTAGEGGLGSVDRVPMVLRPGGGQRQQAGSTTTKNEEGHDIARVPTVLRPGAGALKAETNPFKRKMSLSASGASSQEDLGRQSAPQTAAPPLPPLPVDAFAQLNVSETSNNPWQPALGDRKAATPQPPPIPATSEDDIWHSAKPSREATPGPTSNSPALLSLPSEEGSAGWEDEESRKVAPPALLLPSPDENVLEDSHAWDDLGTIDKGKGPAQGPPPAPNAGQDDWNLIDVDTPPGPLSKQSTWENFDDEEGAAPARSPGLSEQKPLPVIPPMRQEEAPPQPPPRPAAKSETYQIKNINWFDVTAAKNPRTSPILVQNANGPCPLVALVNALSLTTPADKTNTALVETLRSREQVSLGLLLDAVFDELMSERRTNSEVALPDVGELYNFLKGLHTGMNVNPRFIPAPEVVNSFKRTSLSHLHPTERSDLTVPGTFEDTKEMALYATFSIPLIHGWLPAREEDVYDSFVRQATSYEDAQNLLFREEELEEKLSSDHHQGLTEDEQQIYQDILTIKSFLSISATQLTPWGLDVIRQSMKPGSVAILFRNDHFSTLYRHPQTLELLTLVTDAGYASHAEVVWESLADVNGEHAEFFSGDFRLVGGASHSQQSGGQVASPARNSNGDGWQTVQGRRGRSQPTSSQAEPGGASAPPTREQEDRDLALAMQLQEEEDERHRVEQERRRRESMLSEQFIEQQGRPTPASPRGGRGGGGRGGSDGAYAAAAGRGANANGRGGSRTSLSLATTAPTGRRSSSITNIPLSAITTTATAISQSSSTSARGNARGGGASPAAARIRPTVQTVRSLIPPRAQPVNRGPEDGLDDAPPSYEQAAKATAYVPPAGSPHHPASSPRHDVAGGPPSASGLAPPSLLPGGQSPASGAPPAFAPQRTGRPPAGYPGSSGNVQGRYRQGVPPAGAAAASSSSRDRDCVVM
ncbi:hypothetical protein B0T24DRAFT_122628 [Lasiosphaeria ovina]|uniref:MINDY deubiquitinase domain-containing protein n=1 Tax=Lasiosphaeria ovina TaxID=92902 RepID=A0AAE0MYK3_9PEZI|nr:hypothetical protein B0T24DRAFT_122628 [Lasiosphaeria ovina]